MVVEAAVDRLLGEVLERVVHPAHVPLEAEAEPAEVRRSRHARPGGRLLRDREHTRLAVVQHLVQLLQERDGVEILAAAEGVRHPLALLARVVEVEHRGDGVDAQSVRVELAHPVERVRKQEVAHLVAAEVEDERAPVGVRATPRVVVLVERRAVEVRERELVPREVRRHPVEDHADPGAVHGVDERAQLVGRAHRGHGSVEAGHLVAPGARERVVHHRKQLDVGEAELVHVGDELLRELLPAEPQPPRLRVHLVDRQRPDERILRPPLRDPVGVRPLVPRLVDHRGRLRRHLGGERDRVGLDPEQAVGALDLVLVLVALARLRHDAVPDPGGAGGPKRMHAPVPLVPVADDGDLARVRRPHRERDPLRR